MNDLPQPLTPPDCDLKDFQFIPVDVQRLLTSETWVLGTGEERSAAMTLWLVSWHQVPTASLPKDDRMLAHLSQCKNWKKVKEHALRGWIEASDGRLYHPVVAEKALEAWIEKLANSISGAAGNAKRWGVDIETDTTKSRALTAISMLRALAPQSKTLKKKVVAMIEAGSRTESGGDSKSSGGDEPNLSGGDRKGQGQGQGQGLNKEDIAQSRNNSTVVGAESAICTPGEISKCLRKIGISSNPGDMRLVALAEQGVDLETVEAACQKAKKAKPNEAIPPGYVFAIIEGWAKDAENLRVTGARPPSSSTSNKDASRAAAAASIGLGGQKNDIELNTIDGQFRALD